MDYSLLMQPPGTPLPSDAPVVPSSTISQDSTRGKAAEEQRILSELRERTGRSGMLVLNSNPENGTPAPVTLRRKRYVIDPRLPKLAKHTSEDDSTSEEDNNELPKPPAGWEPKWRMALKNSSGNLEESVTEIATDRAKHLNAAGSLEGAGSGNRRKILVIQDDRAVFDKNESTVLSGESIATGTVRNLLCTFQLRAHY
jgi:hypothetical protein